MSNETPAEKAAAKAAEDEKSAEKAAAAKAAHESAKETEKTKQPHVYRTDLGESLPPQKDTSNPDRGK